MKAVFQTIKNQCRQAVLPTIVVTLIFFAALYLFGMENTLIAPFMTLTFLRLKNNAQYAGSLLKTSVIYAVMAVFAYIALLNLFLCILINACALFWIGYILTDDYSPNNYFPFGMALIFYQIAPAQSGGLIYRILSIAAGALILYIFLFLLSLRKSESSLDTSIRSGLEAAAQLLTALAASDSHKLSDCHQRLCKINQAISREVYDSRQTLFLKAEKSIQSIDYIVIFQHFNNMADRLEKNNRTFHASDAESMKTASALLKAAASASNSKEKRRLAAELRQFSDTCCITYKNFNHNLSYILNMLAILLEGRRPHPHEALTRFKIRHKYRHISLDSFKFRFALRLTLVLTPCLAFAMASAWPNAYWLAISVFFMMLPFHENTLVRIAERIKGTLLGIILCFILYNFFPSFWGRVIVMTAANFGIYASNTYAFTVAYITCSALALNTAVSSSAILLLQRLAYTLAGSLIALLASRFVLPNYDSREVRDKLIRLKSIDNSLLCAVSEAMHGRIEEALIHETIVQSYLLASALQAGKTDKNTAQFIQAHIGCITALTHIIALLQRADTPASYLNEQFRFAKDYMKKMDSIL